MWKATEEARERKHPQSVEEELVPRILSCVTFTDAVVDVAAAAAVAAAEAASVGAVPIATGCAASSAPRTRRSGPRCCGACVRCGSGARGRCVPRGSRT